MALPVETYSGPCDPCNHTTGHSQSPGLALRSGDTSLSVPQEHWYLPGTGIPRSSPGHLSGAMCIEEGNRAPPLQSSKSLGQSHRGQ